MFLQYLTLNNRSLANLFVVSWCLLEIQTLASSLSLFCDESVLTFSYVNFFFPLLFNWNGYMGKNKNNINKQSKLTCTSFVIKKNEEKDEEHRRESTTLPLKYTGMNSTFRGNSAVARDQRWPSANHNTINTIVIINGDSAITMYQLEQEFLFNYSDVNNEIPSIHFLYQNKVKLEKLGNFRRKPRRTDIARRRVDVW